MFTPSASGRPSSASTASPPAGQPSPSAILQSSASHNSIFSLSSSSHSRQPSHGDLHQASSPMSLQKMHTIQHILNEPEQHVSPATATSTQQAARSRRASDAVASRPLLALSDVSVLHTHLPCDCVSLCVVLCCVVLCCGVSCCVVLCCGVLCCGVLAQYPCTADDYDILQEIGVGAFATVYRATVNATGVTNTRGHTDTLALRAGWQHPLIPHALFVCIAAGGGCNQDHRPRAVQHQLG